MKGGLRVSGRTGLRFRLGVGSHGLFFFLGGGGGVLPYEKVRDARRPFRGQNLEFWYRLG